MRGLWKICSALTCIIVCGWISGAMAAEVVERRVVTRTETVRGATQILTRGPVHEAFAEPLVFEHDATIIVSEAPPDPITEVPAVARPSHPEATWIPGYWAWDEEEETYIWLSGTWRVPPPDRVWIAGYWAEIEDGHQWVPGFWIGSDVEDLAYYPTPPKPLQTAIPDDAPGVDSIWVPGVWYFITEKWLWEPGYWIAPVENWVWGPAHWVWSPSGYIFVDGFWDYTPEERGLIFAPVRFRRPVYREVRYTYTPEVVVAVGAVTTHMFVRPKYHHYYFGDYYDARYERLGYRPHYQSVRSDGWYDPIFLYSRWRHHDDYDRWYAREREYFEYRRTNISSRPPRTYDAQLALIRENESRWRRDSDRRDVMIAQPVTQIVNYGRIEQTNIDRRTINNITNLQIVEVDQDYRDRYSRLERELYRMRDERRDWERDSRRSFTEGRREGTRERRTFNIAPMINAIEQAAPELSGSATDAAGAAAQSVAPTEGAPAANEAAVATPPASPKIVEVAPTPAGVPIAPPSTEKEPTLDAVETPRGDGGRTDTTPAAEQTPSATDARTPVAETPRPEATATPAGTPRRLQIERRGEGKSVDRTDRPGRGAENARKGAAIDAGADEASKRLIEPGATTPTPDAPSSATPAATPAITPALDATATPGGTPLPGVSPTPERLRDRIHGKGAAADESSAAKGKSSSEGREIQRDVTPTPAGALTGTPFVAPSTSTPTPSATADPDAGRVGKAMGKRDGTVPDRPEGKSAQKSKAPAPPVRIVTPEVDDAPTTPTTDDVRARRGKNR